MRVIFSLTVILFFYLVPFNNSIAQASRTDYELSQKMKQALTYMQEGNYDNANTVFRNILATEKVLPNNLSYHFALTLYHINQYRNSDNFLNKYFKLTGKAGDFYDESLQLQDLLKIEFTKIENCQLCDVNGYKYVTCTFCKGQKTILESCTKCRGVGKISCLKCKGEGVVITIDAFNERKYQTCDRCEGKGIHICDLCDGKK